MITILAILVVVLFILVAYLFSIIYSMNDELSAIDEDLYFLFTHNKSPSKKKTCTK